MSAWWSGPATEIIASPPEPIRNALAFEAARRHRTVEPAQLLAWDETLLILRRALGRLADPGAWHVLLEFAIERLGTRADAVLVCPRGVVVVEFKIGATRYDPAARRQVDDYAIDIQDFHAASRRHPIVPVLVAAGAPARSPALPLMIAGAATVLDASGESFPELLARLETALPATVRPILPASWGDAHYAPVPGIVDAACLLFRRHDVADIATARADATNLSRTTGSIARLVRQAASQGSKIVVFVTGIPGAGKTLCGLATAFDNERFGASAFLTGNPSLVHVLREALVRDAVRAGGQRRAAAHRMETIIQALPRFRDTYVANGAAPPEQVIVVDEAQRSWTGAQAIAKTATRAVRLSQSEPAHLLDIMARRAGFAAIVCLVGNGQEIHDGEGGVAEWGRALAVRPEWQAFSGDGLLAHVDPRSRLPPLPHHAVEAPLHLGVDLRALRNDHTALWADAVLRGAVDEARAIAAAESHHPFRLTRDLAHLRAALRAACRDRHRAGLVASAGARRIRAAGLGAELPHMDPELVARWFLDSWIRDQDVRASDALEVVATQFSVQGLELDHVGLVWDADLVRVAGRDAWEVRRFAGTRWQVLRHPEKISYRLNTYRVLLTRARYGTILFVPRGDADDPTRPPATYDAIADFLIACGVRPLEPVTARNEAEGSADDLPLGLLLDV